MPGVAGLRFGFLEPMGRMVIEHPPMASSLIVDTRNCVGRTTPWAAFVAGAPRIPLPFQDSQPRVRGPPDIP
jgi:hypothetical protein